MRTLSRRTFAHAIAAAIVAPVFYDGKAAAAAHAAPTLFDSVELGGQKYRNRVVMAPLTRGRAGVQRTANALMAEYYAQRAGAGLIIAEATAISPQGYGWIGSPAIYTQAHVAGWKGVTRSVHERGGQLFLQLWHTGRVSHPDFLDGEAPIGPSAITAVGETHTPLGKKRYVKPRAMSRQDIVATIHEYAVAAQLAKEAGFDGVEIHAGNGYLIDQFIRDGSNRRTDIYGGSVQGRLRFLLEITEAVARVWSANRVGVRLSPTNPFNGMHDSQPERTFTEMARELSCFDLAYLHVIDVLEPMPTKRIAPLIRAAFNGPFILNGGYDAQSGLAALGIGEADLIAYGRFYVSNPDLVERFRQGAPLNESDSRTYYTDGPRGYTDYPPLPAV